jgi:hypothetical protein
MKYMGGGVVSALYRVKFTFGSYKFKLNYLTNFGVVFHYVSYLNPLFESKR